MLLAMAGEPDEATLVVRVREGDAEALGALFDLHGTMGYRVAYRLTGTKEDAEDVVQDVFCALPRALARYRAEGTLGAWLRQVTARTALMQLRAARRRPASDLSQHEYSAEAPPAADVALRVSLDSAHATLPEKLREVAVRAA
jgi:RNA polymerase sigma factor (sigma-70 family)